MHLNLVIKTQLNCDTLFTIVTAFLSSLSPFIFGSCSSVVHQPCHAETDSCLQPYNPFHFYRIGTRAHANVHKTFACRYLSNSICTVVEEWTHGYFCLAYFSSSTHFDLVMRLAQKVWRQCVLVFVHDLGFRDGNCNGLPCEHWPLSFHW